MSLRQEYTYTKEAQHSAFGGKTIADLLREIGSDNQLNALEKSKLFEEIRRLSNNAAPSTPLSALMYGAFGALFGNMIAKYFGMGAVGRTISTVVGAGLGFNINNRVNPKDNRGAGWRSI